MCQHLTVCHQRVGQAAGILPHDCWPKASKVRVARPKRSQNVPTAARNVLASTARKSLREKGMPWHVQYATEIAAAKIRGHACSHYQAAALHRELPCHQRRSQL